MRTMLSCVLAVSLAGCGDDACDPDAADTICTVAGSGSQGFDRGTGPATGVALYVPIDTAVSPDGELWLLDFNNYLIRAIDKRGDIRTVAGSGLLGDSPPAGVERVPALAAELNHTTDLVFHDGYLYLAAWHNSRIKRIRLSDMTLENFAGRGRRAYYDGDGGPALQASLDAPAAVAIAPTGEVTILDTQNQVIREVDGAGVIRTIAGTCITELVAPCAPGQQPVVCPDSEKLTCGDPATTCQYNSCCPAFGGDGGLATGARLAQPFGDAADPGGHMAYDHAGNLVFADTDNHRIRKIDPAGVITTIAGTGIAGYAGDDGPATAAQLHRPVDIAIADDDTIYFTDVYNSCIRKIDPAGTISRVAGQCSGERESWGFSGDGGSPLAAQLNRPYGIGLAGDKLYIADSYNNRIRAMRVP